MIKLTALKAMLLKTHIDWFYINNKNNTPVNMFINNKIANIEFLRQFETNEGFVTLNVSPSSIMNLKITDEEISFLATFSGVQRHINIIIKAVIGLQYPIEKNNLVKTAILPYQEMFDFKEEHYIIDKIQPKLSVVKKETKGKVIDFSNFNKNKK